MKLVSLKVSYKQPEFNLLTARRLKNKTKKNPPHTARNIAKINSQSG